MPSLLYSTNAFIKLYVNEQFRGDVHYVWCSETFDAAVKDKYSAKAVGAISSSPCGIYRRLREDVGSNDLHSDKIAAGRASLTALAMKWAADGSITEQQRQDMIYVVSNAAVSYWRPLLFVIPASNLGPRLKLVPAEKRASIAPEYIVEDLKRNEFDILEFPQ